MLVREPGRATWSACSALNLDAASDISSPRVWLGFDAQNFPAVETPIAVALGPKNTVLGSLLEKAKQRLAAAAQALAEGGAAAHPFGHPVCAFVDALDWLGLDLGHPAGARGIEVQWNPAGTSLALRATRWVLELESEPDALPRLRVYPAIGPTPAVPWHTMPPDYAARESLQQLMRL